MQAIETWLERAPLRCALVWLAVWCLLSVLTPIDASYDVLHYHLHNGWSAWEGRLERDLAPAGMHSYFNPLYNLIVHGLILALPAGLVTALFGLLQGAILLPLYILCRRVLASIGHDSRTTALLIALAGFLNYSMLHMVASVRNDHIIAGAFILSLMLLLPAGGQAPGWRRVGLAAFITGLSIGLKLTAIIHAAGLAAAILVAVPGIRTRIEAAGAAALAGLASIVLTGGWWLHKMWTVTGNPVFPMANGIFRSPYGVPENFRDERSLPDSVWDVLLFPVNGASRYNEYDNASIQDLPIGLLYLAILLTAYLGFRLWRARGEAAALPRAFLTVFAGAAATLALWVSLFAIGRYAVSLWMLAPLLFAGAVMMAWPALAAPRRAVLWCGAVAALCFLAGSSVAVRRAPEVQLAVPYIRVEAPAGISFGGATVIMTGGYPSAFLAAHLPETATYTFALTQAWTEPAERELNRMVRERIEASAGPFVAVMVDTGADAGPQSVTGMLAGLEERLGLAASLEACAYFATSVDTSAVRWLACPLEKRGG